MARKAMLLVDHERALSRTQGGIGYRWDCPCCGEPWRDSGCVRGPTCDCRTFYESTCQRCQKCRTHCACTEGYLTVAASINAKLAAAKAQREQENGA